VYLILFILHDIEKTNEILDAWENTGVSGVTILFSTGLGNIRKISYMREDMPIILSLDQFLGQEIHTNRTFFTVVKDQEMVDAVVKATEAITGKLDEPDTGILFVLPVLQAYGLVKRQY
jgi:nitrogen regulatory protein P-II 1